MNPTTTSQAPALFSSLRLRDLVLPNRIVISPMCTYSASDGLANDWHFAHLAKFALGGAGTVFVEATAIEADGIPYSICRDWLSISELIFRDGS